MHPNPPATPAVDWNAILWKSVVLGVPVILKVYWPYILLILILWSVKSGLVGRLYHQYIASRRTAPESSAIDTSAAHPEPAAVPSPNEMPAVAPVCPECGGEMVRRIARRGHNIGGSFYGCINFPACRHTRPVA